MVKKKIEHARSQHVVLHKGKWAVREEGSRRVTTFETKQDAIDAAKEIAKRSGQEVLVHGLHGQIFRSSSLPSTISEEEIRKAVRSLMSHPAASRDRLE